MNKIESINRCLDAAHKNLDDLRKNVKWQVEHDMETSCFEKNMISLLVRMAELKKEIDTFQYMLFIIEVHDN